MLTEVRETIFSIRILKFPWVALEEQKRGWGCGNGSFLNLFTFYWIYREAVVLKREHRPRHRLYYATKRPNPVFLEFPYKMAL